MTSPIVTVYSDYKSPFAFLAKDLALALERELGITLRWLPYTLDLSATFDVEGRAQQRATSRARYIYRDARRFGKPRGLTILGPQKVYDGRIAQIGMLYAQRHDVFRRYHDLAFERFFQRALDPDDPSQVEQVLAEAGADTGDFAAFVDGDGGGEHDRIQEEAEDHGVFGVPTFFVGDQMFWGQDRIDFVREAIAQAA